MAATSTQCSLEQIGETAGAVWHLLHDKGPLTLARIVKELRLPRDLVMQAIGWLAREDKLFINGESRVPKVGLK